jgi:antitoxin (DNA-binding transcriptional repressor) of toxin-antitoxin stability system
MRWVGFLRGFDGRLVNLEVRGAAMIEVGEVEAKDTLGALLDRVQGGEEIVIARGGKVVARLVPDFERAGSQQAHAANERIRARAKGLGTAFHWADLKEERDAGRP